MTSLITCSIDYYSDSILCFDPQKLLAKLKDAFPNADIDRTDLSAAEVAWVSEYTDSKQEMLDEHKEMMRKQIAGKQQRIGPAYRFTISKSISGHVNRYSLVFKTDDKFTKPESQQIQSFMDSLGAGRIELSDLSRS